MKKLLFLLLLAVPLLSFGQQQTVAGADNLDEGRIKINSNFSELYTELTANWVSLSDGSSVTWDNQNLKNPRAKLPTTQSFTLNMTNVADGATGIIKITTNTGSAVTITFDTDFTDKNVINTTFNTYALPALTAQDYYFKYTCDGTTLMWEVIGDYGTAAATQVVAAKCDRSASTNISNATLTTVTPDSEVFDDASIHSTVTDQTRYTIPGSGNKLISFGVQVTWTANTTGFRSIVILKNGTEVGASRIMTITGGASAVQYASFPSLAGVGGDYFEVQVYQNSTATLAMTNFQATISIAERP